MVNKKLIKQIKKDSNKSFYVVSPRKLKFIITLITLVIITITITAVTIANTKSKINPNFYSIDKNQVTTRLQNILNNASTNDKVVYQSLSDLGCDGRNAVGIEFYVHCEIVAQKYYESTGDIEQGLQTILSMYKDNGWDWVGYGDLTMGRSIPDAHQMSQQAGNYLIRSLPPQKGESPQLYVEFIGSDGKYENYRIQDLVRQGKIASPAIGSKIYGFYVAITYWNCQSEDSFFGATCPAPPSKPF